MATRLLRAGVPASIAKLLTRRRNTRTLEKHYDGLHYADAAEAARPLPTLRRQGLALAQNAADESLSDPFGCINLREVLASNHMYLLVGGRDQPRYTPPLSTGLHPDAPCVIARIGDDVQVEKSRAISAAGYRPASPNANNGSHLDKRTGTGAAQSAAVRWRVVKLPPDLLELLHVWAAGPSATGAAADDSARDGRAF